MVNGHRICSHGISTSPKDQSMSVSLEPVANLIPDTKLRRPFSNRSEVQIDPDESPRLTLDTPSSAKIGRTLGKPIGTVGGGRTIERDTRADPRPRGAFPLAKFL